jgi:hypothetical protein
MYLKASSIYDKSAFFWVMIPFVGYLIIFIIFGERKLAFNSLYGVLNVVNASLTLGSSLFQFPLWDTGILNFKACLIAALFQFPLWDT